MPAIAHIHTYIKYKRRPGYFRCEAPNCTHIIDKELLEGKLSLCSFCGTQMVLTKEDLRRVRPRCINCSETKKAKLYQKAQELTKNLGTDSFDPLRLKDMQGGLFPLGTVVKEAEPEPEDDFSDFSQFFKDPPPTKKEDE